MLTKPTAAILRQWRELSRSERSRQTENQFAVEGVRSVLQAVDAGFHVHGFIHCRRLQKNQRIRQLLRDRSDLPIANIGVEQFRQLSQLPRASGIAAVLEARTISLSDVFPDHNAAGFAMAITRMRSLGNLGTLFRSAAAAGTSAIIFIGNELDPFAPGIVRASMGAIFRVPIVRTTWKQFTLRKQQAAFSVVGADPQGPSDHDQTEYSSRSVLMLGDERKGLSSRQKQACDRLVRIPMAPHTDSLNVAVAGSLILYQMRRH